MPLVEKTVTLFNTLIIFLSSILFTLALFGSCFLVLLLFYLKLVLLGPCSKCIDYVSGRSLFVFFWTCFEPFINVHSLITVDNDVQLSYLLDVLSLNLEGISC